MAIKSAYELAMERAKNIKVDTKAINKKNLEQEGKEAAGKFLNTPKFDFDLWVSQIDDSKKSDIISGVLWVFEKNLGLPTTTSDIDKTLKIKEGYLKISSETEKIEEIFTQLITAFQQYIDNSTTLLAQAKEEFAPRLQQKAMQLAQQTGQMVPIDPETDRDFIEFHKRQQSQVDDHYNQYVEQAKQILKDLF